METIAISIMLICWIWATWAMTKGNQIKRINGYPVYEVGTILGVRLNKKLRHVTVTGYIITVQNKVEVDYSLSENGKFLAYFNDKELEIMVRGGKQCKQ